MARVLVAMPSRRGVLDRREALSVVFHAVDEDGSGSIDAAEALKVATGVCASMTEKEALAWFRDIDADDSGFIDESEYLAGMLRVTKFLSDAEFAHRIKDLLARTNAPVNDPAYYFHCADNREYLERSGLLPLLERGLEALVREVEAERLRVASGSEWDDDGYLPEDWRPLRPLRFLGEWLAEHCPAGVAESKRREAEAEARRLAAIPYVEKKFEDMTRAEKLRVSFDAMDRDGNGTLDFDELLFVCRKMNPGKGEREAKSQVAYLDRDGDGQVDQDEYADAMLALMENLDDETFDEGVRKVLTAVTFASSSREEKLRMVFDKVDRDGSGELDRDELTTLARALVPGGDDAKVEKTMRWLDADGDASVTFEEFRGPMLAATEALDDDAFDAATRALLAAEGEAVEPDPADDLPPKFAAFVTAFATHEPMLRSASLIGVKRLDALLKAGKTKVAIVDCRPAEERAVSSIRDAAALGDVQFTDETDNNVAACAEAFEVNTAEIAACDLIVAVSSTGAASHVAAPLLREKANGKETRSLVGGMVAWFNAGGEVVDAEGDACDAVHPGSRRCLGFFKGAKGGRRNTFKFPKE